MTRRVQTWAAITVIGLAAWMAAGGELYVAPDGNDRNPGTRANPLATLAGARDVVRKQIAAGLDGDVTVLLRGGRYRLRDTVVFTLADSPGASHTVTYRAADGEEPVFDAAVPIRNWKKLSADLPGLPESVRDKVWAADLPDGAGRFFTLYDAETLLPRARSKGFAPTRRFSSWFGDRDADRSTLHFPPGTVRRWPNLRDIELLIIPTAPWTMNILPLASVDEQQGVARTAFPGTYGLGAQKLANHWPLTAWIENAPEALDTPGEWIVDSRARKVYLLPKGGTPSNAIAAPTLAEYIRVEGKIDHNGPTDVPVRNLIFRGLTFTHGRRDLWDADHDGLGLQHDWEMYDRPNALVRFRGAERCVVEDCAFVNSSGTGLRLDLHCRNIRVVGNTFEQIGGTGILLSGYGPGTKDVNGHNEVIGNHIHHTGRMYWHGAGIFITQSGHNRIANNLIHHTPYNGMVISGARMLTHNMKRDSQRTIRWQEVDRAGAYPQTLPYLHANKNVVEYNEIHHCMERLGDGNGIYISGAGVGNVIRRNYVHHILGPHTAAAIRTDGCQTGTMMTENIIYKSANAGFIVKYDNDCTNNIIVDVLGVTTSYVRKGPRGYIAISGKREMAPRDAKMQRNIFYQSHDAAPFYQALGRKRKPEWMKDNPVDHNLYFNATDAAHAETSLALHRACGADAHSIVADPLFVDPAKGDFSLRPDSPALKLGFTPIDMSRIGLPKKTPGT